MEGRIHWHKCGIGCHEFGAGAPYAVGIDAYIAGVFMIRGAADGMDILKITLNKIGTNMSRVISPQVVRGEFF
ncbi:hypothetical protein Psfp_00686 [Pelotomaculum sp. FP]|uniref:hypothetical protein n=1 Tax=Pelotomaculum sp. FP TaxID=261474 RepID=UPI00106506ED|nr:hypothetical protein [Pelotomaculum sp. FP]TEB17182.1 hypothetical protein Psfp_00686 [Pelotomaculum sp. FP]